MQESGLHSKNLLILGVLAISISLVTTIASLVIYHNSGDIYLDRSRPGFLPDEEEVETKPESNYSFGSTGNVDAPVLNDFIDHYEEAVEVIDNLESPFSATPLSDESLGIPAAEASKN